MGSWRGLVRLGELGGRGGGGTAGGVAVGGGEGAPGGRGLGQRDGGWDGQVVQLVVGDLAEHGGGDHAAEVGDGGRLVQHHRDHHGGALGWGEADEGGHELAGHVAAVRAG